MNCVNCNANVPSAFTVAIKENRCPACGQPICSQDEHSSILSLSASLVQSGVDLTDDAAVKVAAALFGKFDVFPKGVVENNQVTKEVIYIREAAPQYPYGSPAGYQPPPQQYQQPYPYQAPPQNASKGRQLATRKAADSAQDRVSGYQDAAKAMASEYDDEDLGNTTDLPEVLEEEADRLARARIARMNAQKAGIL